MVMHMIIIVIFLLIMFLIWSCFLLRGDLKYLDDIIYKKIKIKEAYTNILKIITNLASSTFLILLCFILLIVLKNKFLVGVIIMELIINAFLIWIFKHLFKRKRPNIRRLVYEKGYSYPSGHTMSATSFYGFLIFLVCLSSFPIFLKTLLVSLLILIILIIGYSRIYLGVHYFSDVIGALFLASSYVLIYVYIGHFLLNFI